MNLVQKKIEELKPNPVQPMTRHTESAVQGLIETILESGFIAPIVVCGDVIVDGHRRWEAAKKIGAFPVLDCIEVSHKKATPTVWFIWLNKATRNVKGNDWFCVWAHSTGASGTRALTLKKIPASTRSKIEDMVAIFGQSRAVQIGKEGRQSPDVAGYIRQATRSLTNFKFIHGTEEQIRRVGEWVLQHKQTLAIKRLLTGKGIDSRRNIQALYDAIQADKPLGGRFATGKKPRKARSDKA